MVLYAPSSPSAEFPEITEHSALSTFLYHGLHQGHQFCPTVEAVGLATYYVEDLATTITVLGLRIFAYSINNARVCPEPYKE
jgi:hypothetical protein